MVLHADEPGMDILGYSMVSGSRPSGETPENTRPLFELILVGDVDLVAVAVALGDFGWSHRCPQSACLASADADRRPAAWCRPDRPSGARLQLVALAATRSSADNRLLRLAELGSTWRPRCRPCCARLRAPPSACRSRCRNTAPCVRARTSPPRSCLPRRARQTARHQDAVHPSSQGDRSSASRTPRDSIHSSFTFTRLAMPPWYQRLDQRSCRRPAGRCTCRRRRW
jgi:hypothetical protein